MKATEKRSIQQFFLIVLQKIAGESANKGDV